MSQNKFDKANIEFYDIFRLENMNSCVHRINPLVKLIFTLVYIISAISFGKYNYFGLFIMLLIPVTLYQLSMIPVRTCFYKLRVVLPFVLLVGIFNPILDRKILFYIGTVPISGGVISMITILLKGLLCLMASFLLVATTKIEDICGALVKLHVPKYLVNLVLLTFRYIFVLTEEAGNMWTAYRLRAPSQRGIKPSVWGTFLGQLILRTMDRSRRIYENMVARGYMAGAKSERVVRDSGVVVNGASDGDTFTKDSSEDDIFAQDSFDKNAFANDASEKIAFDNDASTEIAFDNDASTEIAFDNDASAGIAFDNDASEKIAFDNDASAGIALDNGKNGQENMINLNEVTISYVKGEPIINCLNLDIKEGCTLGIIGPNGAGKTTLFKGILGLLPAEGDITIDGDKLSKKTENTIRAKVGYVAQNSDDSLFMPTVLEDMIFAPVNYGASRDEAIKKAKEICTSLGMNDPEEMYNYKLSGGIKRMASIATALSMEPKVLLMDEPSSNLDPKNRRNLINALRDINVSKVIATHDLDLVLEVCDRVVILNGGTIVADGEPMDILANKSLLEENDLELPFCLAGVPNCK